MRNGDDHGFAQVGGQVGRTDHHDRGDQDLTSRQRWPQSISGGGTQHADPHLLSATRLDGALTRLRGGTNPELLIDLLALRWPTVGAT